MFSKCYPDYELKRKKAKEPISRISFPVSSQSVLYIEHMESNYGCAPPTELSASLSKCKHPTPTPKLPLVSLKFTTLTHSSPPLALEVPGFVARLISQALKLCSALVCAELSMHHPELCACVLRHVRQRLRRRLERAGTVASEP